MKAIKWLMTFAMVLAVTSCIKKEPLNAECDIVAVTLPGDLLNRTPIIENDRVTLIVKNHVNITDLAPEFELTPGATIAPPSGTKRDFTEPQTYVVTSEDGEWTKAYTIAVQRNNAINLKYGFEDVKVTKSAQGGSYDVFFDVNINETTHQRDSMFWASGNSGFAMTNGKGAPDTYPTFQTDEGYVGKCACLVTRSTGSWGALVNKPIAAGNLFIGKFDLNNAIAKPLEATQFGTPFFNVPRYFSGYFKYTPGDVYQQFNASAPGKLEAIPGKKDECNIYAVYFESTADMEYLNGANVLSDDNPNIIAVARISEEMRKGASDWTYFHVPFVFREGATIDADKFEDGRYSIAVVMTSSIDGDYFSGAIGSTLFVDELEIICL
ncbi:PCMD domain-containing protein [uncultured Duncaniella sp.]|uniref:PCMD domain-containing protein n=1 Tax=uncultured Duncaniella sp. TaxID=2768039 RepID=UPI0026239418|nr:PCMD domain-containing protein [uncultured Duncaniella sp.]